MRTTVTAVKEIISTSLTDPQVRAFITDASLWVTEELTSSSLTAARLEVIERYLTCALIRLRDLGLSTATLEDVAEKYQVDPQVTDYLLRAAAMDPTGKLRKHFLPSDEETRFPVKFSIGTTFTEERVEEE